MKAIIVPLNNIFLDFEKHDGSTFSERFRRSNPKLVSVVEKGGMLIVYCIAGPIFIFTILYIAPFYLFNLIFYGRRKAKQRSHQVADKIIEKINRLNDKRRINIFELVSGHQRQGYELLVYYSPAMIPSALDKRTLFHNKIDKMRLSLKIFNVFQATTQTEIENAITIFGIDIKESIFIPNNSIIPSNYKELNEENLNGLYF